MAGARLESPLHGCDEWTDVEIDEQVLVLPYVDVSQRFLNYPSTFLESVEMAGSQGLGMSEDCYCPLDKASLQSLFKGMSNLADAG